MYNLYFINQRKIWWLLDLQFIHEFTTSLVFCHSNPIPCIAFVVTKTCAVLCCRRVSSSRVEDRGATSEESNGALYNLTNRLVSIGWKGKYVWTTPLDEVIIVTEHTRKISIEQTIKRKSMGQNQIKVQFDEMLLYLIDVGVSCWLHLIVPWSESRCIYILGHIWLHLTQYVVERGFDPAAIKKSTLKNKIFRHYWKLTPTQQTVRLYFKVEKVSTIAIKLYKTPTFHCFLRHVFAICTTTHNHHPWREHRAKFVRWLFVCWSP